jgi:hypothetical protein
MYIYRIPIHKLKKFVKGGAITISPNDVTDQANKQVKLVFGKLKDQRRMLRNFRLGKGFVLKPEHVNDIEDEEEGGSIMDKFVHGLKKIAPFIDAPVKEVLYLPQGPLKAGYSLGFNDIGRPLSKAIKGWAPPKEELYGGKLTAKKVGRQSRKD